jgi:hypothetical protein
MSILGTEAPRHRGAGINRVFHGAGMAGVTTGARPAMMAGAEREETRSPLACRRRETGLEGVSRMVDHPWPLVHCTAPLGFPEAPNRGTSHRLGHRPPYLPIRRWWIRPHGGRR